MCISYSIREEFDSPLFEASLAMAITWYGVTYFQGDNDTEVSIGISFSSCWYFKNSFFSPKSMLRVLFFSPYGGNKLGSGKKGNPQPRLRTFRS